MGEGKCPVIPPVHWKGDALPQQTSRTLKTLSNYKGFYSVFSAVERFLYLRTDQLDGPAGRTSWTDQFSLLEALASLYIVAASESDKGLVHFWGWGTLSSLDPGLKPLTLSRELFKFERPLDHLDLGPKGRLN